MERKSKGYSAFKMKGHTLPGVNQRSAFQYRSPVKEKTKVSDEEARENLLKAVPNKAAYDKLSEADKKEFDKTLGGVAPGWMKEKK